MIRFLSAKDKQQVKLAWKMISTDLGLTYREADHPALSGIWEKHAVAVKIHKDSGGRVSQIMTGFELSHRHAFNTSFQLSRQGLIQSMIGMVGAKDIQIGDSSFDEKVLVRGWDHGAVRILLQNDKVRDACLNILTHFRYANIQITNEKISGTVAGMVMTTADVQTILHHFLKVALLLKDEGARIDTHSERAIDEESKEVKMSCDALPEGDEIAELIFGPLVEKTTVDSTTQLVPVQTVTSSKCDNEYLSEIAKELLGWPNAEKRFDEFFKDKEIDWNLKFTHIIPAGDDSIFGKDSGWIATVDPGGIPGAETLKIKYRIGQIRKESIDRKAGSCLEIQGRLVEFESPSNTLYIDSGDAREKANSHSATVVISI